MGSPTAELARCEQQLRNGDISAFVVSLDTVNSVNEFTASGESLVHVAVDAKSPDAIKALISRGASMNAVDTMKHATPLHYAVARNDVDCVLALLEGKADPNIVDIHGNPPLWHALLKYRSDRPDVIRPLLDAGASIEIMNRAGMSSRMHLMRVNSDFIKAPFRERGLID